MISQELLDSLDFKLIVTIVKKGAAKKVVKAAKRAHAGGSTILLGIGHGIHEHATFLGFHLEPEKEIVLTAVPSSLLGSVLAAIAEDCNIDKPGNGIGFVIDIRHIAGISHQPETKCDVQFEKEKEMGSGMASPIAYELIVTIVNKGMADTVVDATKQAGAEGGTIVYGRGTGIHEQAKLFSITIEPEKELVLTLIDREKTQQVMKSILEAADLDAPGKGIAFVLPVERTVGIPHKANRS